MMVENILIVLLGTEWLYTVVQNVNGRFNYHLQTSIYSDIVPAAVAQL